MSDMNFLERLLDGVAVEWKPLGEALARTKGTKITAGQMKELHKEDAPLKIFAGGKTIAFVDFEDIPEKDINREPSIIVKSRGFIEFDYYDKPFSHKNEMWSYHSKDENINIKFVYYLLKINEPYFQNLGSKMQMPQIATPDTDKFQIPIPPLKIQAEIVRILDTFTALTAELTAELSDRKKQYNYYRDRLLTFEDGEVEWKTLGEITRIFSASRVHKNEWTTSGVPFYRTSDVISIFNGVKNSRDAAFISNELYETLSSKSGKIQKNDILVTGGGTIGIPYIVPTDEPLYFKDADLLCIKKSKTLNSKFLYHYFLTTKFRIYLENISHNSTIAHYTISQITKTPVPVPPLEEQARIVAILDKFDTLTHSISEGLPREIALRQKQYEYYRDLLLSFPPPLTPP